MLERPEVSQTSQTWLFRAELTNGNSPLPALVWNLGHMSWPHGNKQAPRLGGVKSSNNEEFLKIVHL
jgi:hypothetical protein